MKWTNLNPGKRYIEITPVFYVWKEKDKAFPTFRIWIEVRERLSDGSFLMLNGSVHGNIEEMQHDNLTNSFVSTMCDSAVGKYVGFYRSIHYEDCQIDIRVMKTRLDLGEGIEGNYEISRS